MILFANCKINIGLDVLRRREDGYHDIQTLMYPVTGLADSVEIVRCPQSGVHFTSSGMAVNCPAQDNLCTQAYNLIHHLYNIGGVRIHLHKCIPFEAGLGGGSSDAAAVIVGLNTLFTLGLTQTQMESLAAQIGSDTAFFVRNVTQMASGRGEILNDFALTELAGKHLLIVKHNIAVSTGQAYAGIAPRVPQVPLEERLRCGIGSWRKNVTNDFEHHVFELHPALAHTKAELYEMGAIYAAMSGSGAAVYGIFDREPQTTEKFGNAFVYQQVMS